MNIDEEFENKIFEYLSNNLIIDVNTEEEYVGSLGDGSGSLYKSYHTIKIILEDKVITSAYLS